MYSYTCRRPAGAAVSGPWTATGPFYCSGLRWRVVAGVKAPGDMRLEVEGPAGWVPVKMEAGFLLADFFFDNESRLYPRSAGFRGGYEYLRALHDAARFGWERAATRLQGQKLLRRRQEAGDAAEAG